MQGNIGMLRGSDDYIVDANEVCSNNVLQNFSVVTMLMQSASFRKVCVPFNCHLLIGRQSAYAH